MGDNITKEFKEHVKDMIWDIELFRQEECIGDCDMCPYYVNKSCLISNLDSALRKMNNLFINGR